MKKIASIPILGFVFCSASYAVTESEQMREHMFKHFKAMESTIVSVNRISNSSQEEFPFDLIEMIVNNLTQQEILFLKSLPRHEQTAFHKSLLHMYCSKNKEKRTIAWQYKKYASKL